MAILQSLWDDLRMNPSSKPARSIDSQSGDNGLGLVILFGVGLILAGWFGPGPASPWAWIFFALGIIPAASGIKRLLRPGCNTLLRVNLGGVTDFRLSDYPLRWERIEGARRWGGPLGVILLHLPEPTPWPDQTPWSRILHLPLRLTGSHDICLLTLTLDQDGAAIFSSIKDHLAAKKGEDRSGKDRKSPGQYV